MSLLHLSVSFSVWIPSLSVLSQLLSLSLRLTLYYASLSNHVIWHLSSAFSLSIFSSPLSSYISIFSFVIPLSWSVSLFLPLCSNFPPSLCDIARFARAHTHAHTHFPNHTYAQSQSGIPWMRLTGLFELCGTALRDCVWSCIGRVCMCVGGCLCDTNGCTYAYEHVWQSLPLEVWNRGFEADAFVMGLEL